MYGQVKHICFDKDGTLTDVHQYWAHTSSIRTREIIRKYGLNKNKYESIMDVMGIDPSTCRIKKGGPVGYKPRQFIVQRLFDYFTSLGMTVGIDEINDVFILVDKYQQESNDYKIVILPGVFDFIEGVFNKGIRLTIFSSDRKDNTLRVLRQLSLGRYFRAILGGDSVTHPKPHPEGFIKACNMVASSPTESVYVSDTLEDLEMANAGKAAFAIGVETGLADYKEMIMHSDYVYKNLSNVDLTIFKR